MCDMPQGAPIYGKTRSSSSLSRPGQGSFEPVGTRKIDRQTRSRGFLESAQRGFPKKEDEGQTPIPPGSDQLDGQESGFNPSPSHRCRGARGDWLRRKWNDPVLGRYHEGYWGKDLSSRSDLDRRNQ